MPDVEYAAIPTSELEIIKANQVESWFADTSDSESGDAFSYLWDDTTIFTLKFGSALSEDDFMFRRVAIAGRSDYLYFFDATLVTGIVTITGIGDSSDATAIRLYLRLADYTGESLPNKIDTVPGKFDASKSDFLLRWQEASYYRDNPDLFQEHYDGCDYEKE